MSSGSNTFELTMMLAMRRLDLFMVLLRDAPRTPHAEIQRRADAIIAWAVGGEPVQGDTP